MYSYLVQGMIVITAATLRRLEGEGYINDELVNASMVLLNKRDASAAAKHGAHRRVWCASSFFYSDIEESGYQKISRWLRRKRRTSPVRVFGESSVDRIIIPIHIRGDPGHWTTVVVDLRAKMLTYYDSCGGLGTRRMERIWERFLQPHHKAVVGTDLDRGEWRFESPGRTVPQQSNSVDCGVFAICFATFLSEVFVGDDSVGLPLNGITQQKMPFFRERIGVDIVRARID